MEKFINRHKPDKRKRNLNCPIYAKEMNSKLKLPRKKTVNLGGFY